MKPKERQEWIAAWLRERNNRGGSEERVDVLYSDFVIDYIEATGASSKLQMFGAPKCPQLGRDLGAMHAAGILKRHATGLSPGDASMGFPKWVWSYHLPRDAQPASPLQGLLESAKAMGIGVSPRKPGRSDTAA